MTYTQPPTTKSRLPWLIAAAVAALIVGGTTTGILVASRPAPTTTTSASTPVEEYGAAAPEPELGLPADPITATPAPGPTLHASDVKLTAKITKKQCFGSAGCLVDFKVQMAYDGPALSPDDTWEVTYEVTGVEDGPLVGSFDVTGDTYDQNEESVDTTSARKKIAVKVTGVDKVGI